MSRREFLRLFMGVLMSPSAALAALNSGGDSSASSPSRGRLLQLNAYPADAETPLDALNSYITPNELFFIRSHYHPARPNPATWRLAIDGLVSTPLRLSLSDLKKMPQASATCVLQCAGNSREFFKPAVPGVQWRWGAVGNAKWTGVKVRDVLERAGLKASARHLHVSGYDVPPRKVPPFRRSVEMGKILQDGIIAYEMNGAPIPAEHGAPARLVVPGWAGDHWMKWLARLSPRAAPQTGFYMDTAYRFPLEPASPGQAAAPNRTRPLTELFVKSNITEVPARAKLGAPAALRGFAFSGAPDISRVEISDDGGRTWKKASLDPRHDPYAWRLWSFQWTPKKLGRAALCARATDSRGNVQPKTAAWNPGGYLYNAWQSVSVEVVA